ncbi:CAF17-like 4Fe-4S cluster assembly/insertion protein YgfZ [Sphingomonas abietis]|uniref:Folate-binding protein n=1 Tax=Sphingomonas abietis TaxID=3012344 RepID=A0ABY7NL13_9SPHN|nr:folate-binding protein [Sphingomonas abietis]WBO22189.1 folate-binding protein [Sphingomonas abietis]
MSTATLLAARALIRLSGADVAGFLQGLVTNDTATLADGQPVWAGLLTAQGKAQWDFLLWPDGDDILVDCEAEQADALAKRLTMYRLRRPITIARDDSLAVHWRPELDDSAATRATADPRLAALGSRWLSPAHGTDTADLAWRTWRLGHGVTEGLAELGSDKTLWLETNAVDLHGVSFTKGCYVGQENTARMNWRQKVNRRLVVCEVDADPGEAARAWYPDLGLAVALVRVEHLRGDGPVRLGTVEARPLRPAWLAAAIAEEQPA